MEAPADDTCFVCGKDLNDKKCSGCHKDPYVCIFKAFRERSLTGAVIDEIG